MAVRFSTLVAGLRALGDGVTVVTPCVAPPATFHGAAVVPVWGAPLPFYRSPTLLLSPGLSPRLAWTMLTRRPSLIHASAPGVLVYAAIAWARLLDVPLVVSYHTHIPAYIPKYTWPGLVAPMWTLIRAAVGAADLTLVPSGTMKAELAAQGCKARRIEVWPQAVDTETFNPRHRSSGWHARLAGEVEGSDAEKEAVVLAYVGRLGNGAWVFVFLRRGIEVRPAARAFCSLHSPLDSHALSIPKTHETQLKREKPVHAEGRPGPPPPARPPGVRGRRPRPP
jgi:sulfoquinovosyltransferase